jgi:uncharacterized protein YjbI with pentapeptide repeats
MATSKTKAPRPPVLSTDLEPLVLAELTTRQSIEQRLVEAPSLAKQRAERVSFDGVRIVGGTLAESKLASVTWLDVVCERTDLSLVEWPNAELTRAEVSGCRGTGAKFLEGRLESVRFVECQLDYASFVDGRFRQVTFVSCRLREADFRGADLSGVVFDRCDLQGADFAGAKLVGTDVTTSEVAEIRIGVADVRGLVLGVEQTPLFARLFGLVVR